MVKQYLKYVPTSTFGIINSYKSNVIHDNSGKLAFLPALESIKLWDIKKGVEIATFADPDIKHEVSFLTKSNDARLLAAGYTNGVIRIWDISTHECVIVFNGHHSEVTYLEFDTNALRLVSGSKDTDIIVWDIVNESGLYRLKGHRNQITQVSFIGDKEYLISGAKDSLIKVWDLTTQHCIQTIIAHKTEVNSMYFDANRNWLFTGSNEQNLKLWKLDVQLLDKSVLELDLEETSIVKLYGEVERSSKDKVMGIMLDCTKQYLVIWGSDKTIEIQKIRTMDEVKKKITRRLRRLKEKNKLAEGVNINDVKESDILASDLFLTINSITCEDKIKSFDILPNVDMIRKGTMQLLIGLNNNLIQVHTSPLNVKKEEDNEAQCIYSLEMPGHRSDIRSMSMSSDDELLATCSNNELKIWNLKSNTCIRTIECGIAVCCTFLPGDRHVVVGTKSGHLELFDVASASLIESVEAHEASIWSIHVAPDKNGFVTGSADKDVKFWDLDTKVVEIDDGTDRVTRQLTLTHSKTLQMTDDVLCVLYSPDQKLLAVSMIDTTVKVFFTDSLKLFLSLYGHKLPVLSMDISTDNHLIVTSSADKNIKIWGLDFGDCHKSLFAHQEAITTVKFVKDTHYFFSCSKDKLIKYWDGDKFENIMKLEGHHNEIWCMALSQYGTFLVTGSADRSIRVWERTDEPLFLEEEKEKELEELFEASILDNKKKNSKENEEDINELEESSKPTLQTMQSLKGGELIIEALEISDREISDWEEYNKMLEKGQKSIAPPQHPILAALKMDGSQYVLNVIRKIKSSDLEDALLVLPFDKVISLLKLVPNWVTKDWCISLISRMLNILLKVYHQQIVSNKVLKVLLEQIKEGLRLSLNRQKDAIGYNLAGLKFLQRNIQLNQTSNFFGEIENKKVDEDEKFTVKRKIIA
ncbi:WD40 repeat-like protein [Neoconidiobolus thromboides FSU 785]|nr:WD40 repeat-like protein [Neoconidiobolus thromboides FSU 785]